MVRVVPALKGLVLLAGRAVPVPVPVPVRGSRWVGDGRCCAPTKNVKRQPRMEVVAPGAEKKHSPLLPLLMSWQNLACY